MIADATAPLSPGRAPAPKPDAPASPPAPVPPPAPASGATPARPGPSPSGALAVSPGNLILGAGSAGQLTLTAAGGPVSWSASASAPQVSLNSGAGTLQTGQSVTLDVTVTRDSSAGGSAVISIQAGAASPQTVAVSWAALPSAQPSPGGWGRPHRHGRPGHPITPPAAPPSGSTSYRAPRPDAGDQPGPPPGRP